MCLLCEATFLPLALPLTADELRLLSPGRERPERAEGADALPECNRGKKNLSSVLPHPLSLSSMGFWLTDVEEEADQLWP